MYKEYRDAFLFVVFGTLALVIFSLISSLSVSAAPVEQTDQAQTLALENWTNVIRQGYNLQPRVSDPLIRSAVRIVNVMPKDGESTLFAPAVSRALRVSQFKTYDAYYAYYEAPGRHEAAEIVNYWNADPLLIPWIFKSNYTVQGCAWWFEANYTWAFCAFANPYVEDATSTPVPSATSAPVQSGGGLATRTPVPTVRVARSPTPRFGR